MLLAHIRSGQSVPELLKLLSETTEEGSTRALNALGRLAHPQEATPALVRVYRDAQDEPTRRAAALALERIEARAAKAVESKK